MTKQKWTYSSANNPCPICDRTKDGDCRVSEGGSMVLCHSSIDGKTTKDGWKYIKPNSDDRCGIYVTPQEKSPRPRNKSFTHCYIDRQGREHVQCRRYDAAGISHCGWAKELGVPESELLPYRWEEVKQAIADSTPIYLVEGELVADELMKLGLTATNLRVSPDAETVELFRGANLIICPDRDKTGIKKAQAKYDALKPVAASTKMCLSEPKRWDYIPEERGRDLHDWIIDGASREDIEGAIAPFDLSRFADKAKGVDSHGYEDYLSQIERLLQIEDPVRRGYEIWAYSKNLGCSPRQVEAAIAHLSTREKPDQQTVFTLGEFLALPMSANQWIVPGLIPERETLIFAGQPKEGKSLLAYDLAYGVATGKSKFLGTQPLTQGRVLMVLNDESQRSIQIRLLKRGFTQEDSDNVRIVTSFNIRNLSELEQHLIDFKPCLTIIDSLKSISRGSELSENSAEFADGIYNLKELLDKWGSAGVLIHHTNKDRESQGVAQLRGSTAIAGAVWGVWLLKTPQKRGESAPPLNRFIEVNPREGERKTLNVELEPENNSWKLIHAIESDESDQTAGEKIIALLKKTQEPLEYCQIKEYIPDVNENTLKTALRRLVDALVLSTRKSKTTDNFVYELPGFTSVSSGFTPTEKHDKATTNSQVSHPNQKGDETRYETTEKHSEQDVSANLVSPSAPLGGEDETNFFQVGNPADKDVLVSPWFHPVSPFFKVGDRVIIKNLPAFLAKYRRRSLEVQTGTHEVVAVKGNLITTLFAGKRYHLNSDWLAFLP